MAIPTLAEAQAKSLAAAQAQTTPLTPEEASLKKLQDYYAQVARAETTRASCSAPSRRTSWRVRRSSKPSRTSVGSSS